MNIKNYESGTYKQQYQYKSFYLVIDQNIKPSLKTLEPHALKALIYEDLKIHPNSSKNEIMSRLPDINVKEIQKILYRGCDCAELIKEGATKNRTYSLANKKEIKKKFFRLSEI